MALTRYFRSRGGPVPVRRILVCVLLVFILFARGRPPSFPLARSHQAAISCDTHHEQRPCFEREGPRWGTPVGTVFSCPRLLVFFCLTRAIDPLLPLEGSGFYYTRPPPVS